MMRKRIRLQFTLYEISLAIVWAIFFQPPIVVRISSIAFYGMMLLGYSVFFVMFLRQEKKIPVGTKMMFLFLFLSYCTVTILMRTPDSFPVFVRRVLFPIVEFFFLIRWTLGEGESKGKLGILYYVSAFYMTANFISLFLFPNGIIRSSSGSAIERAQWLFGSKNNIPMYMIIFLTISVYYYFTVRRTKAVYILAFMGAFSIMMSGENGLEFLGGSSTGFVSYAAVIAMIVGFMYTAKIRKTAFAEQGALFLVFFINLVILKGISLPGMNDLIVNVLHKSLTFTGRTLIWGANMKAISEHLLFGQGEVSIMAHVRILSEWVTTDYTYNCLLKLLLNYGIIGVGFFAAMILSICRKQTVSDNILYSGFIGLLIIGLMNEIEMNWLMFFPIWLILTPHALPAEEKKAAGSCGRFIDRVESV